jgi:uncharacterized membrane protein
VRGYLIVVTVFVLGAVAGGTSVFSVLRHRSASMLVDDRVDEQRLEVMTSRLGLDGAQRERIAGILNDARREARVITHETDAKCGHPLLDHRAKVDDRIRAELRAPQQATFDALLARRREREAASPTPP